MKILTKEQLDENFLKWKLERCGLIASHVRGLISDVDYTKKVKELLDKYTGEE